MKKLKLALLGCGYLNEIVANALKDGYLPEYELIGVLGKDKDNAKDFANRHNCQCCDNINNLLEMKPDYIAEAASVKAIEEYSEIILNGGSNLIVLSIGAFADANLYSRVKEAASRNNKRVYIASGAVGGFDILRTAALMSPITASISSKKSPGALFHTPLYKEGLLEIQKPTRVFVGNTKEAIAILPGHVNVAVATALASAGPENTIMNIDALPDFRGDEYKIEIVGNEVKTELNIYSRTSKVAAWSVIAILQNIVSPIVF